MTKSKLATITHVIAEECRSDYVGVWAVLWEVKRAFPKLDEEAAMEKSLAVLRDLLQDEGIKSGEFEGGRFVVWTVSPKEIMVRIQDRWASLGREPGIGDIGWLLGTGLE